MLSLQAHDFKNEPCFLPYQSLPTDHSSLMSLSMGGAATVQQSDMSPSAYSPVSQHASSPSSSLDSSTVAQALEIARESPEGARDQTISNILESALSHIWNRVLADPDAHVMSTEEFAVFNFFQHRFTGNKVAIAARKRYWDNTRA